jgi:hypothetical protein
MTDLIYQADIITASIGDYGGWANNPWALVASRLVEQGVVVTIAAGNDGEQGPFYTSTGSSGANVLAVASVDPSTLVAIPITAKFTQDGKTNAVEIPYIPSFGAISTSWKDVPVYPLSLDLNSTDTACQPLPPNTPDLTGKMVLVRVVANCETQQQVGYIRLKKPKGIMV